MKIGFIGTGVMGTGIVNNLLHAGVYLNGWAYNSSLILYCQLLLDCSLEKSLKIPRRCKVDTRGQGSYLQVAV